MVLVTLAAIFGLVAGSTLLAFKACVKNPEYCSWSYNHNNYQSYWRVGSKVDVITELGSVRGATWTSTSDNTRCYAFLGIPYAETPLRFEAPVPRRPWNGILDATTYRSACLQRDRRNYIVGSEDCLFLNIFTPRVGSMNSLIPVMVWIDGSLGWQVGSGDKVNPKNFMKHYNVILVTINYRLSSLGFLSTGDGEIQGNMGLKDQVLALQFIKRNIVHFGGDPNRITIFGQDSGAASVHYHMLSPLSKGLFQRAISQGGTALCPWAFSKTPVDAAKRLATMLNCDSSTTNVMANCMKWKSGREILNAEQRLKTYNWNGEPYAIFRPVAEKMAQRSPAFIAAEPKSIANKRQSSNIPWIVGFNEEEGRYFVTKVLNNDWLLTEINNDWNRLAPISYFYEDSNNKNVLSDKIRKCYFGGGRISHATMTNYTNSYTDRYYLSGSVEAIKIFAVSGKVYPYVLKFRGDYSYTPHIRGNNGWRQAPSHFDELYYLFNWEWISDWRHNGREDYTQMEFRDKLVQAWISFAETGVPKGWGTTPTWSPMSSSKSFVNWYVLDYNPYIITTDVYKERIMVWK